MYQICCILIQISPINVPKCLIDNFPAFIQISAAHWADDKPLIESMVCQFDDAYIYVFLQNWPHFTHCCNMGFLVLMIGYK